MLLQHKDWFPIKGQDNKYDSLCVCVEHKKANKTGPQYVVKTREYAPPADAWTDVFQVEVHRQNM